MKVTFRITLLAALTLWVAVTAIRIERLNAESGIYLPRRGSSADGKWRISLQNSPRDRLRALVQGVGLLQYLLAPVTAALGLSLVARGGVLSVRIFAVFCTGIGLIALCLAFYRGYFTSLGW